jgi:hypothetical protein
MIIFHYIHDTLFFYLNIHERRLVFDWQLCELSVKLVYLHGYSKVVPSMS